MIELGTLERVDLRQIWTTEAGHFTPWLARENNLRLLGEAVGIELELEAQEKSVGPFRADLLCKDTATNDWVLIENQLERTDHTHLGQLLTYAAGLKAVTIIWIANPFTEEHRAALDWLNEITDTRFNFFGLEVELWRIGDSPFAPKFNVVCKPNDWSKTVSEGVARVERAELSDTKQLQLEYWTAFREFAVERKSFIKPTKPLPQHWMNISLGRSNFGLLAIASVYGEETQSYETNEIRAEVNFTGDHAKSSFGLISEQQAAIEEELAYNLHWHNPENAKSCRIYIRRTVDLLDRNKWSEQHQWLTKHLEDLHRAFSARIRQLTLR